MYIRYLVTVLILFMVSCGKPLSQDPFSKEREKRVYSAVRKFKKAMEIKGYHAAGLGEGLDPNNRRQNYLGVTFDIKKLPDIDFARKIEVEALQEFLKYINAEEGIQDYLAEYPYPLKFVHVAFISQQREEGLFSVANCYDEIYYSQEEDLGNIYSPLKEVHSESYEDAVRILNDQKRCLQEPS